MKSLLARRASARLADQAIVMFCHSIRKEIGAFAAVLGGLDMLVFTRGIGEHASPVREEICRGLSHFGGRLHAARNASHDARISSPQSTCQLQAFPPNQALLIPR